MTGRTCPAILVPGVDGLGTRIREARLEAGLTQTLLARVIETSERNIVRWESGQNTPRTEHLAAIAHATQKPLAYFLEAA